MNYRMSPNVAIPATDADAAIAFYSGVLGFSLRSGAGEPVDIAAHPLSIFLTDDAELVGPVLELFVEDVDTAREELVANGCEVVRWRGRGQDCYLRDPFGVTFNLWEEPVPEP